MRRIAASALLSMLLAIPAAARNFTAAAKVDYSTGYACQSVAIANLNPEQDNWPDLVTANSHGTASVVVLKGTGGGRFSVGTSLSTSSYAVHVAVGDLNGDGKLDLAVATLNNWVSVFLGNGDGTFGSRHDISTVDASYVAIGNLNPEQDNWPDLVVVNGSSAGSTDGSVAVLMGTGTGTSFTQAAGIPGLLPSAVAIGELNGDNIPDLAVTLMATNAVAVFPGTGGGSFGGGTSYPTGTGDTDPRAVAVGELNGQAGLDLVVANYPRDNVAALRNDGFGSFALATGSPRPTGDGPLSVAIGDLNGDGWADLAVANLNSDSVSVLQGNGDGTFAQRIDFATGNGPCSVAIGDLNADGYPDLALANRAGHSVSVLLALEFLPVSAALPGVQNGSVAWGDYDADGDQDILITGTGAGGPIAEIYRNGGGATPTFSAVGAGFVPVAFSSVAWGDCDDDGDLDVLLTGQDAGAAPVARVYRNGGGTNPVFTDIGSALTPVSRSSVAWGDYDNDGDLDILLVGNDEGGVPIARVYQNGGAGSPGFTNVGAALGGLRDGSAAWGDCDGNGDLDILITGEDASGSPTARVYRNSGGANPAFSDIGASIAGVSSSAAAWGDYDNDGDLDILLSGQDATLARITKVYRNSGGATATFTDIGQAFVGVYRSCAAWGDYDNDGDPDILLAGMDASGARTTRVYRNGGGVNPAFKDLGEVIDGAYSGSVAWADYDGDTDLDFLLTGSDGAAGIAELYRHELTGHPNLAPLVPTNLRCVGVSGLNRPMTLVFSWNPPVSDDHTPVAALSYNLRVGTTPGGSQVLSAASNLANGYRRIPAMGNIGERLTWTATMPAETVYYWSVQAVDGAFAGSSFAPEQWANATVSVGDTRMPRAVRLEGAPNPFTRLTTLDYVIPQAARVRLQVSDIGGRNVRELVAAFQAAGPHRASWDGVDDRGSRVAAGMYFVRLRVGSLELARRVVFAP